MIEVGRGQLLLVGGCDCLEALLRCLQVPGCQGHLEGLDLGQHGRWLLGSLGGRGGRRPRRWRHIPPPRLLLRLLALPPQEGDASPSQQKDRQDHKEWPEGASALLGGRPPPRRSPGDRGSLRKWGRSRRLRVRAPVPGAPTPRSRLAGVAREKVPRPASGTAATGIGGGNWGSTVTRPLSVS